MLLHRLVDHVVRLEATVALARLVHHAVVSAGLRAANTAASAEAEPLLCGLLGLHLGHDEPSFSLQRAGTWCRWLPGRRGGRVYGRKAPQSQGWPICRAQAWSSTSRTRARRAWGVKGLERMLAPV